MHKLFYYPRNASWASHMVLTELNVPFELVFIDRESNEKKFGSYLSLNPTGRIPTFVNGSTIILERAAICICELHPQSKPIPATPGAMHAKFYQWLFYLAATLQPEFMMYFYSSRQTTGSDALAIATAQEVRVAQIFIYIDTELGSSTYLVGNHVSVCDYFLFMLAHWAREFSNSPLSFKNLGRFSRGLARSETIEKVYLVKGSDLSLYL